MTRIGASLFSATRGKASQLRCHPRSVRILRPCSGSRNLCSTAAQVAAPILLDDGGAGGDVLSTAP